MQEFTVHNVFKIARFTDASTWTHAAELNCDSKLAERLDRRRQGYFSSVPYGVPGCGTEEGGKRPGGEADYSTKQRGEIQTYIVVVSKV
jgi:hypothetical protein